MGRLICKLQFSICDSDFMWNQDREVPGNFGPYEVPKIWFLEKILNLIVLKCTKLHFVILWFYVKLNLAILCSQNCSFGHFGGPEIWFLRKFHTWKGEKLPKLPKLKLYICELACPGLYHKNVFQKVKVSFFIL